jgi:hypothetical protein
MISIAKAERIQNNEVDMYIVDLLHNGIRLCAVYDFNDVVVPYQLHGLYRIPDSEKPNVIQQVADFMFRSIAVNV